MTADILALIQQETGLSFKKVAATHGGEYAGPCPWCGGNDRFLIWPQYKGGRYWCRGCEKKGDGIQFIRNMHGLTFGEACERLGITRGTYRKRHRKSAAMTEKPFFKPKQYEHPPELWTQKTAAFLKYSQEKLWTPEGRTAREFLQAKGLIEATIRRAGIGFNPSDLYRDRRGWGLLQEIHRPDGKAKLIWLPAGIVIPLAPFSDQKGSVQNQEGVARLRIRRFNDEGPRYVIVAGSSIAPLVLEPDKSIFVVVESELDAWLLYQEVADLTGVVAMGSAGLKPDVFAHSLLTKAEKILNALDYDEAGARPSWKFWPETYGSKVIRWPVPIGKDPSDAWQQGLNIREWIEAEIN
ncbi:MAG: primase-helicase zinc-binding domain-containing protein [Smithella sp.]